ncbi:MAG: DUF4373 domain-containing protein, partial [Muribaculaceae bacterium]|nr:DUF4373 domain-containing protein [Muribaculaceae bacterium]
MKIDSKFLSQQWFRAIAAEFGPDGQIAVIHILVSIFESPRGYWRPWELVDCFEIINSIPGLTLDRLNKIVERLTQYGIFDRSCLMIRKPVLTSAYLQREFIRQCGTARARRLRWTDYPELTPQELLELGVIAAVDESQTDAFDCPCVDPDEPIG